MSSIIAQQLGKPQGFLSRIAAWFFTINNDSNTKWVIQQLDVQPGSKVLVIGFGTGTDISEFVERVGSTGLVYGIEVSEDMLHVASDKNREAIDQGIVKLSIADAQKLAAEDYPKFDYIFHANVIYFWDEPVEVFKSLSHLLSDQGKIVSCVIGETLMTKVATKHFKRQALDDAHQIEQYGIQANLNHTNTDTNSHISYVIHTQPSNKH